MTVDSVAVDASSTFTGVNPLDNAALKAMMAVTAGALDADPSAGSNFDWTFTSASGDGAFNFLAAGETLVLKYTLKGTDDSGVVNNSDTQVVTVTITGTNDAPDITGTAISADKLETDTTLTATGTVDVMDVDLSDTVTMTVDSVAVDGTSTFAGVNPLSNPALKAMMAVTGGALAADPLAGSNFDWTFTSGSSGDGAFNFLADGETLVLKYTLKGTDDSGVLANNSDTQVVTVTFTGTNDRPDITAGTAADLQEDTGQTGQDDPPIATSDAGIYRLRSDRHAHGDDTVAGLARCGGAARRPTDGEDRGGLAATFTASVFVAPACQLARRTQVARQRWPSQVSSVAINDLPVKPLAGGDVGEAGA